MGKWLGLNDEQPVSDDAALDALIAEAEEHARQQNFQRALETLEEATQRFADSPLPWHAVSVVHLLRIRHHIEHAEFGPHSADWERVFERAGAAACQALDQDPEFVPALNNLATLYALQGDWAQALRHWESSLTLYPDQPRVREEMAEARSHLGQ